MVCFLVFIVSHMSLIVGVITKGSGVLKANCDHRTSSRIGRVILIHGSYERRSPGS